jgi:hypothetical protein
VRQLASSQVERSADDKRFGNLQPSLLDAGVLDPPRRAMIEYPVWSTVHGLAVLTGQGPLRDDPTANHRHLEQATLAFIEWALA